MALKRRVVPASLIACANATDDELRVIRERRGWWRGEVIAGYCEFQTASIARAP
jgi:hypothetical protein